MRARSAAPRRGRPVDVAGLDSRQGGNHGPSNGAGYRLDRLRLARGCDGETCLDDVHTKASQLLGDLDLLFQVQRDARRLLAVSQCRIEDSYIWLDSAT